MNNKKYLFRLANVFLFLMLLVLSTSGFAQDLNLPCDGGDPDVDCPIDTGTMALAAAVLFFGLLKINRAKGQTS